MAFALQLHESLEQRQSQLKREFAAGVDLRTILTAYLTAVESSAETELQTSILLLDESGKHLRHAAGPSLPQAYCDAIDGGEIGPSAGSCGTAAFLGHAIYVTDIETDPLWADYRQVALENGLRACWSTPIFDPAGAVIGTFAIYHPTPRSPTADEVKSIATITERVAEAILLTRDWENTKPLEDAPALSVVQLHPDLRPIALQPNLDTIALEQRLEDCAARLTHLLQSLKSNDLTEDLTAVANDCWALVDCLRRQREQIN